MSILDGRSRRSRQAGLSFIELVMFVVIVSVGVAGILSVFYATTQKSADPQVRKQLLAIGDAMLEEIELMPFTYCDPDDANATTAAAASLTPGNCASTVEGAIMGPEANETRYGPPPAAATFFDNVNDYNGFDSNTASPTGIRDPSGTFVGPAGYRVVVAVSAQALGTVAALDVNNIPQSVRIDVTVTGPRGESLVVTGFRTRYAPNSVP